MAPPVPLVLASDCQTGGKPVVTSTWFNRLLTLFQEISRLPFVVCWTLTWSSETSTWNKSTYRGQNGPAYRTGKSLKKLAAVLVSQNRKSTTPLKVDLS